MQRIWVPEVNAGDPMLDAATARLGDRTPQREDATVVLIARPLDEAVGLAEGLAPEQICVAVIPLDEAEAAWRHLGNTFDDVAVGEPSVDEVVARVGARLRDRRTEPMARLVRKFAHDLNNPLTAVRLLSEMLLSDVDDPTAKQDLQDILEAADVSSALVENLSGFVKAPHLESGATTPVDLRALAQEVLNRPFLKPAVSLEPAAQPALTAGDRSSLKNAVLELCHTGRRLVANTGGATVTTGIEGSAAHLTISTGADAPDPPPELFRRFAGIHHDLIPFQLPPTGLYAAARTARLHGGRVTVHAAPSGVVLRLTLPTPPTGTDGVG